MSKIFTKVSSMALAAAIVGSGLSVNVDAAELESKVLDSNEFKNAVFYKTQKNVGVNDVGPGVADKDLIVTYGTSKPTDTWNLSTKGSYYFEGYLNSVRSLYTNYLFTGKSSVRIDVWNKDNLNSMKFKVKRKDLIFDNTIETYTVKPGQDGYVNLTLDKSSTYYIEFLGPCNFSGTIK